MNSTLSDTFFDDEFLYRGVVDHNWDYQENRPSSATFKDSKGVSVNREARRTESECVLQLLNTKAFKAIVKISVKDVNECNAISKYTPIPDNEYHSEIHDSIDRVEIRSGKARSLQKKSIQVYMQS